MTCPELNLTCSRRDELPAAQFVGLGFLSFVVHIFFWCHVSPQFDSACQPFCLTAVQQMDALALRADARLGTQTSSEAWHFSWTNGR